ncbi:MAG TPA: head GIN domain-containing protein [Chitinophagaceae bacterium]|nr:head GIN domain-containing protein [Chitinophagaceae bacterium]
MKHVFLYASLVLLASTSSCRGFFGKRVRGDGHIQTENRTAGNFHSVDVSGSIDLYVKQDSSNSIRVETDENLLSYVEVFTEGDKLVVRYRNGFNIRPSKSVKVYVSAPAYKRLEASGASDIYSEGRLSLSDPLEIGLSGSSDAKLEASAPRVSADLSGACTLEMKGETKDFSVEGSGSTNVKCLDLLSENAKVDLSGAGDAEVYASVRLDVEVSGAASVRYKGNASVSQQVSGAGSVKKVD